MYEHFITSLVLHRKKQTLVVRSHLFYNLPDEFTWMCKIQFKHITHPTNSVCKLSLYESQTQKFPKLDV